MSRPCSKQEGYHTELEFLGVLSSVILKGGKLSSVSSDDEGRQGQESTLGLGTVFKANEILDMIINSAVMHHEKIIRQAFASINSEPIASEEEL